jgi:hypothetical protein
MSKKSNQEILDIINGAAGTDHYYRFSILTPLVTTDGVMELALAAECFWLLDVIASH